MKKSYLHRLIFHDCIASTRRIAQHTQVTAKTTDRTSVATETIMPPQPRRLARRGMIYTVPSQRLHFAPARTASSRACIHLDGRPGMAAACPPVQDVPNLPAKTRLLLHEQFKEDYNLRKEEIEVS